jgi:hypothetical protein
MNQPKLSGKPGPVFDLAHHQPLLELYRDGLTRKRIAILLGRTEAGIKSSIARLRHHKALPPRSRVEWPVPRI